jgi:hypothetical protein
MSTIASLIVDVAANTATLTKNVDQINGQLDRISGAAASVAASFGFAFSAEAVISFTKSLLADADALEKMSDQTGIGVQWLQKLQVAGDDAGNALDELTHGITKMEDKLAGGDASAVAALSKLGLGFESIKDLTPEQQFLAISDAIRTIQNPQEQVNIAVDLFGKAGAIILPTLKRGFDDLKDSVVGMSDDTVKSLDTAGDTIQRWWRSTKSVLAEAIVYLAQLPNNVGFEAMNKRVEEMAARTKKAVEDIAHPKLQTMPGAGPLGLPDPMWIKDFTRGIDTLVESNKRETDAATKATDAHRRFLDTVKNLTTDLIGASRGFGMIGELMPALTGDTQGWQEELATLSSTTLPDLKIRLQDVGHAGQHFARDFEDSLTRVQRMLRGIHTEFAQFAETGIKAFKEIKGIWGGEGSAFQKGADTAVVGLSAAASALHSTTLQLTATGAAIGSLFGPIGTVIGAGVGAIAGGLHALFADPEKKINPIRQAFVNAAGGLGELNRRAAGAGVTLDHLLDARTPEAYKVAIDELNAAFKFQDDAMKTLDDTVQKYGFTLEELGPALQRQNLDKQAQQLYQDFKVLTGAGIDIDTVLGKMGDSVNDFVHDALKTGVEIPAALAPVLQRMVELGQLTDENGNIITDLQAAGVKFSMTMSEGFEKLIGTVERLTDAITRGLGLAIQNIPAIDVPVTAPNIPTEQMAAGGSGRATGPMLFFTRGNEDFAFSGEGKRFASGAREDGRMSQLLQAVAAELRALRQDQMQLLPLYLKAAVAQAH